MTNSRIFLDIYPGNRNWEEFAQTFFIERKPVEIAARLNDALKGDIAKVTAVIKPEEFVSNKYVAVPKLKNITGYKGHTAEEAKEALQTRRIVVSSGLTEVLRHIKDFYI